MATPGRYFRNPATSSSSQDTGIDAHAELLASLDKITKLYPPVHTCSTGWSFSGLYSGPSSIAFLFYKLSLIYPDLEFGHQSLRQWAEAYLELGARVQNRTPTVNDCGIGDETLVHLALEAVMSEESTLANQVCSYAEVINSPTDDVSNEWLYGRAGYLYLLRLCQGVFTHDKHPRTAARIERAIKSTANRILLVRQPWTWHGNKYLGAADGFIGIITQVVLSVPSMATRLQPLLLALLDHHLQFPSGNFPPSLPVGSDRLVQFCHGGPSFVISLRTLLPYFPEIAEQIQKAMGQAQSDIWQRGLLTKEPCLRHGITGNALAFDDDDQFLHFLSFLRSDNVENLTQDSSRDNDEAGLYTGEAGRAWCWAVADKKLPKICLGYNDV
ncbi:hypothetical protein F4777DRAFT_231188 [Nemania sp. FL0916]|nr:hypothetical protein F4777DRAFT_231188 [Nemania sp. FL0916]